MIDHQPHPFARFVRILGRGKSFTRSLTLDEAEEAMTMILAGEVLPEQLGAFLMLLRLKEESAEEIAGFARAARKTFAHAPVAVDVDWPSYAGKSRQLPWFILSALVLARNGWRVFMHSFDGHTAGRLYTGENSAGARRAIGRRSQRGGASSGDPKFCLHAAGEILAAIGADHVVAPDPWLALAGSHPGADAQSL